MVSQSSNSSESLQSVIERVVGKSIRADGRNIEAYGPHDVLLKKKEINIQEAMQPGTKADVCAHFLTFMERNPWRGSLDMEAALRVIPTETWTRMGFDKDDLINSRKRSIVANKCELKFLAGHLS